MNISEKVMTNCAIAKSTKAINNAEAEDKTTRAVILESTILTDWIQESVHQLTRTSASNTVRVAADNLLVTIAARHTAFRQVPSTFTHL